ncbi:MAG: hypothetical protein WC053_08200 [Sideroxydans sp.]|jgi:hypothetical protein
MPTHNVTFDIPQKMVLAKDVEFNIKSGGSKLGTLLVSKGNVEWIPSSNSVNKYRLSWEKFAALMETQGRNKKIK